MSSEPRVDDVPILVEFETPSGLRQVSLSPEDLAEKSSRALDGAMSTIRHTAQRFHETIDALAGHPSETELTFGIKLEAEAGALIAKIGGEATIGVRLTWKRPE